MSVEWDESVRRAIEDALDETLVVEAAAGTGKTTALVRRIIRVLATGRARMVEIVAVTFTEKAAGELKLRLREALERERTGPDAVRAGEVRERLDAALSTLEDAHVSTIHGFCAELLRERPVEAGVDPLFTVLTEPHSARLYRRAFRAWLQATLQDPPEGVRRALRRSTGRGFQESANEGPVTRLERAGSTLAAARDFPARWSRPAFDRVSEVDRLVSSVHALAHLTRDPISPRDNLHAETAGVRRLSAQIDLEQSHGRHDYDGWEAQLVDFVADRAFKPWAKKGNGPKYSRTASRTDVLAARDALGAALGEFRKAADADLAACLQNELAGATAQYQELKAAAGALDYVDLLTRARDLIAGDAGVRRHLQTRFRRIFVDEFQDTDPVQAEILLLLAADDPFANGLDQAHPLPGKLFIVGDPKQAIYRFRGTDVGTYWRVCRRLEAQGGRSVKLTTSYRSVPTLQRFVNAAFAPAMTGDERTLQAAYVPLSPFRTDAGGQPSVVALPVPRPYGRAGPKKPHAGAVEASLPDATGAFIAWLVDDRNGWTVAEPGPTGDTRVPIRPKHIAVLFRRLTSWGRDVTRGYTDAIEARGVPHLLVGGKTLHDREEVEAIRAALSAIEWPDDELSVFATLKGSLFAIDDAHLLEFRHRFGRLHPFRVPKELGGNMGQDLALTGEPATHLTPIADALRLLQQLHRGRNYRPVAETLSRLLGETRAHVGLVLRPAGEQALANVFHVAELARQYEAGGGISFRGFIDELRTAAESEAAEAPILEESSDGVRLMTVHKAKGLEFPVVILADPTAAISRGDASRYVDPERRLLAMKIGGWAPRELHDHEADEVARDEAEGVRLAYVAATRARDLLVVPAIGDAPWEGGWLGPITDAVYPPLATRRTSARAERCPAFRSKDSVLERPDAGTARPTTVCPGLHTIGSAGDSYQVVWWDPSSLELDIAPPPGLRRADLVVRDVPKDVVADGLDRYERWRRSRAEARVAGSSPSLIVRTAREVAADAQSSAAMAAGVEVRLEDARQPRGVSEDVRGGPAFGALVHAVLALAALDADAGRLRELATVESRVLGLAQSQAEAAATIVGDVLAHDLLRRAREAERRGTCRRETPITEVLEDGTLVEGVVDLAFEEDGQWTVVDYKTDRDLDAAGEERYRRQVAFYGHAIARATGQPARGVIVLV